MEIADYHAETKKKWKKEHKKVCRVNVSLVHPADLGMVGIQIKENGF